MLTLAAADGGDVASQLVQVVGALLVLAGFAAAQFGWMSIAGRTYLALNFAGSVILAVLAAIDLQLGFLLLEFVWAIVSLWGLIGVMRGRPPAAAH